MSLRDNLDPRKRKSVKNLRKQLNTGHGKPPKQSQWAGEHHCPPGEFSCWKGGGMPDGSVETQGQHGAYISWGSWECCSRREMVYRHGGKLHGRGGNQTSGRMDM